MTKPELVKFIMENTDEYKKTHLMDKHKADLEVIASQYQQTPAEQEQEAPSPDIRLVIEEAYADNEKMVRGPRLDKIEFKEVVFEKVIDGLTGTETPSTIHERTADTMAELLKEKVAFCPINYNEELMLTTIPLLDDYKDTDSVMDGKAFLKKVGEIHGIETNTSRALMVSLMKKKFFRIMGVKSGQKKTTIVLLERGIRRLTKTGLLTDKISA